MDPAAFLKQQNMASLEILSYVAKESRERMKKLLINLINIKLQELDSV